MKKPTIDDELNELFLEFRDDNDAECRQYFADGVADAKEDQENDSIGFKANQPSRGARGIESVFVFAYNRGYDWQHGDWEPVTPSEATGA